LEQQADEQQKRKVQWGPTQRILRPRSFLKMAKLLCKELRNLKATKTYKVLNL
jgi:hypothetical protein